VIHFSYRRIPNNIYRYFALEKLEFKHTHTHTHRLHLVFISHNRIGCRKVKNNKLGEEKLVKKYLKQMIKTSSVMSHGYQVCANLS
jgi:hypothetical protein